MNLFLEQFGMISHSDKIYYVRIRVKPDEEKVALNMTFHIPFIPTFQKMWPILCGNRGLVYKHLGYPFKGCYSQRIFLKPLEIFFKPACKP